MASRSVPDLAPMAESDTQARLDALDLYEIMDTPAEVEFDDIAHLAADICESATALVSLVAEERQWFKARVGFDACQTPIGQSICVHALQRPGLLVIPDLTADPRSMENTLVTGPPHIRFYAGARLETPEGIGIGTLCVLDDKPRPDGLTDRQASSLERLARQVMTQFALRRAINERDAAEERRRFLNEELAHRMKNTMATVQAIATQTLRGVTEREAVEAFGKRLHAIASAHGVLLQRSWSGASMAAVVEAMVGTFDLDERFDLSGPPVDLAPRATLSLSLLLHELATNALKYGSLSSETGRIAIGWRIEPADGDDELVLEWRESGGPPPSVPRGRGFGSRLIAMGLAGTGGSELRYPAEGFFAVFKAPVSQVVES
ncbi:histidine kinase [Aureimonas altamirensis]|uniref:sensor histidine kinase n=1 Tax=Aureimonas altamirensis TaxID=370622 RepID=UPI00203696AF|nr:HWE histidine kinase domain-containing protein [Aureimonas altamirensis]MCM2503339.1 histidine kinase [Aureimonas altamirensis]